jgi:hypothetical protein
VLHPQPSSPSAFFSSSNLQQASALLVGVPPQHPEDALVLFLSTLVIAFFSNVSIVSVSILIQIKVNNLFSL